MSVLIVILLLLVAACSSSGSKTTPSAPPSIPLHGVASTQHSSVAESHSAPAHDYASPDGVISALSRSGVRCLSPSAEQIGPQDRSYVEKATGCTIGGERVDIAWFATAKQRGRYLHIGLQGTGSYPHFVLGSTWAVATLTAKTATRVATAIGGKVY